MEQTQIDELMENPPQEGFVAAVSWHPVDLLDAYPEKFSTYLEAVDWLALNEEHIQEAMTKAGWDAIDSLI